MSRHFLNDVVCVGLQRAVTADSVASEKGETAAGGNAPTSMSIDVLDAAHGTGQTAQEAREADAHKPVPAAKKGRRQKP
jgi:hypothetical protein